MPINTSWLKRLVAEDFDTKDQSLVSKIGAVINPAIDQIGSALQNGLNVSDLNTQYKTITLTVDSKGNPTTNISFPSTLTGKCTQIHVGRAQNLTSPTTYPTSGVTVSFTASGSQNSTTNGQPTNNQIIINNVTGLTAGDQWQLTLTAYV